MSFYLPLLIAGPVLRRPGYSFVELSRRLQERTLGDCFQTHTRALKTRVSTVPLSPFSPCFFLYFLLTSDPCFCRPSYANSNDVYIRRADSQRYEGFCMLLQKWIFFSSSPTSVPRINLRSPLLNVVYRLTRFTSLVKIFHTLLGSFFPCCSRFLAEGLFLSPCLLIFVKELSWVIIHLSPWGRAGPS